MSASPSMGMGRQTLLSDGGEARPENCICKPTDDLPCFECFMAGFDDTPPVEVDDA